MKKLTISILFLTLLSLQVIPQEHSPQIPATGAHRLGIYLEGAPDLDYVRTNLTIVDYYTEPKIADVHVLVTAISTASGGMEYKIVTRGQGRFSAHSDTVVYNIPGNTSDEITRSIFLQYLQLGLVPYLVKSGAAQSLSLFINDSTEAVLPYDPWKSWMFEFSASGSLYRAKTYKNYSLSSSFYVSKITPKIKVESANHIGKAETWMYMYDDDILTDSYHERQNYMTSRNLLVWSLGDHCGIGGIMDLRNSTFSNYRFQAAAGPAIELNLFSYEEASNRQLRLLYSPMFEHNNYYDTTVFDRMKDDLLKQELKLMFMQYQTWGYISASAYVSNYLRDFTKYNAGLDLYMNINLTKGFSFYLSAGIILSQVQISLRKGDMTSEEWYRELREMQNDYSISISGGFSYRFGSIFNNTVNPRFENF